MKGVLSWLVRWDGRAGPREFCPALAALVSQPLAGSRVASTVSYY
jgi:hypothetical protein